MQSKEERLITFAKQLMNNSFSDSETSQMDSMDINSGSYFVQYVYSKSLGINVSEDIKELINEGFEVKKEELLPGDLVFTRIDHVGIYIGNNEIIHYSDGQIQISEITNFYKGRRIRERINNNEYINNYINTHPDVTHGEIIFHSNTALHQTDENWEFLLGDYNNNGILDLYCINKKNTQSNSEVYILDGSTNFKTFLLQTGTALHETGENFQFLLGDYNKNGKLDLYCIKKCNTGTNSTEVHILDGNDNFQSFLYEDGTALPEVRDDYDLKLDDYNNNGKLDLYCIKKSNTEANYTEVHILNGNDNFKSFVANIETKLPVTDKDFSFYPFKDKLYAINKKGNNCTEIICLKI